MTYQEIEVFLAVIKMGSVSGAAQALYITQPAVSRHIRSLEQELGCSLLERGRGKRQIQLTAQGRDFVDIAKKWILLWQEAQELWLNLCNYKTFLDNMFLLILLHQK